MPRVSEAHLAARRQQILDAAEACFRRNGFHATSMQDVLAEAGLSVGGIYRYFRSKSEIIAAIAEKYASEISATIAAVADDPDRSVADVMQAAVTLMDRNAKPDGVGRLAVQVWAEALRDETVGAMVNNLYTMLRDNFVRVARRAAEAGELPPDADPAEVGSALFSLVLGYGLQRMLTGQPDRQGYLNGVNALLPRAVD